MKNSYLLHFSPEVEQIIHPVSYQIKKTGKYIVAVILTLSQQYSDQDNLKFSQLQSNKRWHTINEIYEPAFGKCLSGDQLQ